MTFRVLFVCTGNVCRSPMAEHLARAAFSGTLRDAPALVSVGSAGTWGHEGSPMEPEALQALDVLGLDGAAFRARELTGDMVAAADLVLTAAREHEIAVLALDPGARERVFGLAAFARLVGASDPVVSEAAGFAARARAVVSGAAATRALSDRSVVDADLRDPLGAPVRVFAESAAQIRALLVPIVSALAGTGLATPVSSPITHAGMVQP